MEIDLALLADAATVDGSGKLNILGVFDRIAVRKLPARHGRVSLVLRLRAGVHEAGKHDLEIRLRSPSGKELVRLSGSARLGGGTGTPGPEGIKVPQVVNLDGIVFHEPGLHHFDVRVDGEHHVSIPLLLQGPSPGGEAEGSGPQGPRTRPVEA